MNAAASARTAPASCGSDTRECSITSERGGFGSPALVPVSTLPAGASRAASGATPRPAVQLTVSNTRTLEQKKALFAAIAKKLGDNPGIRPQDVFINLVEVVEENWSFGRGLAQYA